MKTMGNQTQGIFGLIGASPTLAAAPAPKNSHILGCLGFCWVQSESLNHAADHAVF
jgi:hypothetical protein